MALDCGRYVFVHIPRTAGKWTRMVLQPYKIAEIGGVHEIPEIKEPDKIYFCWERDLLSWFNSIDTYLNRPDSWWDSIKEINPTWEELRLARTYVPDWYGWLRDVFLQSYYLFVDKVIPFDDRIDWLSKWVDNARLMMMKDIRR